MSLMITFEFSVPGIRRKRLAGRGPRVITISLGFVKIIVIGSYSRKWLIEAMHEKAIKELLV